VRRHSLRLPESRCLVPRADLRGRCRLHACRGIAFVLVLLLLPGLCSAQEGTSKPDSPDSSAPAIEAGDTSEPVATIPEFPAATDAPPNISGRTSEIVGFLLQGRRFGERLAIQDLDSLVVAGGIRLLPLLRLLRALNVRVTEKDQKLSFSPEGVGPVVIDLSARTVELRGRRKALTYVEATSEITLKRDLYLVPEMISEILDMAFEWDNEFYEYRVRVSRPLSIWRPRRVPLLDMRALYVPADIPEMHPPAERSDAVLHFVEFDWRPDYRWRPEASAPQSEHEVSLGTPRETLWGTLGGGRYKVRISHPEAVWDTEEDVHWARERPAGATLDFAEWVYRLPNAEVALGDSSFGLGDLTFPGMRVTGIRANGLTGFSRDELEADKSDLGLRNQFTKSYEFEGNAPVGSRVQLVINDRVVDEQEVLADPDVAPGSGTYRFEDVRLEGGILNEVVIVVTDADGNETRYEKDILGSPPVLPKGRSAYLGVFGSRRNTGLRTCRAFEAGKTSGVLSGGRFLYGLSDRFTVGALFAVQDSIYRNDDADTTLTGIREYPQSTSHLGGLFSWTPLDQVLVSVDAAISQGQGEGDYDDYAVRARGEVLPARDVKLRADVLNYGSDYFDGQNLELADRRAYGGGVTWHPHRDWRFEAHSGYVRNNLDGEQNDTLGADYQSLAMRTTALPRTTLTFGVDRLSANWQDDAVMLGEFRLRTAPVAGLDLYGQVLAGEDMDPGLNRDLFSQLRLPGLPEFRTGMVSGTVRKALSKHNSLSVTYRETDLERTATVSHDASVRISGRALRFRSEFQQDFDADSADQRYTVRNRAEYSLDEAGRYRVSLTAEWDNRDWELAAVLSAKDLLANYQGKLVRARSRRVRADSGAVHGVVFLDYNANAERDPGEPGVPGIRVKLGRLYTAETDDQGYYILPAVSRSRQVRVFLDMDSVPAIYSPTHGTQLANTSRGTLTEVNLGITPLISVTGLVVSDDEARLSPIRGVRVELSDPETGRFVADSITAQDGSYYFGNLHPGRYRIRVDLEMLPDRYQLPESERVIQIAPRDDVQQLYLPDFVVEDAPVDQSS
jgi:hypothetical protein